MLIKLDVTLLINRAKQLSAEIKNLSIMTNPKIKILEKFSFYQQNRIANKFELSIEEIKEKYLAYLKSKDIEWVQYYGHETVIAFVTNKDGLDSSMENQNYNLLQDALMDTRHLLYLKSLKIS